MPGWMEFHDSYLESAQVNANGVVLLLDAYVHRREQVDDSWAGTGWSQPVRIFVGAPASSQETSERLDLYDGCLTVETSVHHNWLPLPFSAQGLVNLWFELRYGGRLEFTGRGVTVELIGQGTFVEDLPDDMRPSDAT